MATCSIPGAKFFGCSVVDFNASAGWGAQSSEVTINLVADCEEDFETPTVGEAATFKIGEFSFTGMVQSWNSRGGSDGFFYLVKLISPHPILDNTQIILDNYQGCVPFYNILNVYGYLESLGGGCSQHIVGPEDSVDDEGNVIAGGKTVFGAPSGGFGTANKTARGIPWYLVKNAIQSLTGGIGLGGTCYSKGLRFKGTNYILDLSDIPLANKNYRITGPVISLTDLINQVCEDAGCDYYIHMFDSGGIGSTSIIKVVTIARKDGYTLGQIRRFVEDDQSKVISKAVGQELRSEVNSVLLVGAKVKQYYQCIDPAGMTPFWGWDADGNLLEAVQEMQVDEDTGQPIVDGNGDPIPKVNGWKVKLDFRTINLTLNQVIPQDFGWIGENQLRAAAADFESFRRDIQDQNAEKDGDDSNKDNVLYKYFTDILEFHILEARDPLNVAAPVQMILCVNLDDPTGAPGTPQMRDAKALHHWLASYASQVYGKQFLAYFTLNTAPGGGVLCRSVDADTGQVVYSDDISADGGWASALLGTNADGKIIAKDAPKILDLPNPSTQTDFFKDESGKVQPMIQFNAGSIAPWKDINIQGLSNDDFITKDNKVWIKASVDEKWVNGTPINPDGGVLTNPDGTVDASPVPNPTVDTIRSALLTLSNGVVDQEGTEDSLPAFRPVLKFTPTGPLELNPIVENARNNLDGQSTMLQTRGDSYILNPHGMGIPVKSNTICYGPWQAAGADPGSTQVEMDDGLAPWEYGGYDYMDLAGQAKIDIAYTDQQTADRGEVTVPGIPTLSLAENIDGGGGIGDRNVGRASISIPFPDSQFHFSFYYWNSKLNGGAVISNISVSAGQGGVTTTYTVNSFTPVFGRFSKGNADRLKRIGLNRQKGERDLRARGALRNLISASQRRTNLANAAAKAAEMKGQGDTGHESATVAFAGKLVGHSSSSHRRHVVVAPQLVTMRFYAKPELQKTAVNTLDGFFRPVQSTLSDDGNLPKVNSGINTGCDVGSQTTGPPPPVWNHEDSKATGSTIADSLNISARYLNFLVNADEADYKNVTENPINWIAEAQDPAGKKGRARDSTKGHDVEGVARGVAGEEWTDNEIAEPQSGAPGRLLMVSGGLDTDTTIHDYNDDYRFMALRGPLMIHGWGYDINGKPIPNKLGDSIGSFTTDYTNLKNEFADDWLEDSNTWPVAPVDLRFDRKRGVWTVPSAFRLYQIAVTGSGGFSSNSTDTCEVIKYKQDLLNDDGSQINTPEIQVENWTNTHIASGTKALAYYDTAECKYWIIPPPSGASGTLKIGTTGCSGEGPCVNTRTCIPCTDTTGCLIFSGGLAGSWRNDIGGDLVVTGPTIRASGSEGLQAPHHFDSLVVGSGMSLLVENCSGIISASGGSCISGITTGIPFVQDVCCSGSTFITIKREMTFSKGCLTSVTETGTCPTC